jgi:nicotinamidase-related amidase
MASQGFDSSDAASPTHYPPSQTALLLLDYHSYFVEKASGEAGQAAFATAVRAREWAKSLGIHVIHCLVNLEAVPYHTSKNKEQMGALVNTVKGIPGAYEEPKALTEGAGTDEPTFYKPLGKVSALTSPGLPEYFKEKGFKSLIVMGLSTSGAVLRTAIPATDLGYIITVVKDGCADRDQEVHDVIVNKILLNRAWVVSLEELKAIYKQ